MKGRKTVTKSILLLLCLVVALLLPLVVLSAGQTAAADAPTVILDPGHGGFDPGAIGVSGTEEDDLNLAVALLLKAELESRGITVLLTREKDEALGQSKTEDMHKRRDLIANSGAHCAVIIHMNSHPDASCMGPVAIHYAGSENGARLAGYIQQELISRLQPQKERAAYGETYFILKGGAVPSVIVECGFLSNPTEEALLLDAGYQNKLAFAIAEGVTRYLTPQSE